VVVNQAEKKRMNLGHARHQRKKAQTVYIVVTMPVGPAGLLREHIVAGKHKVAMQQKLKIVQNAISSSWF